MSALRSELPLVRQCIIFRKDAKPVTIPITLLYAECIWTNIRFTHPEIKTYAICCQGVHFFDRATSVQRTWI